MEKQETIFADGIRFFKPNENAPEFIKGNMSFDVDKAVAFLLQHKDADGKVRLDLCKSKEKGTLYLKLNTYKRVKVEEGEIKTEDIPI